MVSRGLDREWAYDPEAVVRVRGVPDGLEHDAAPGHVGGDERPAPRWSYVRKNGRGSALRRRGAVRPWSWSPSICAISRSVMGRRCRSRHRSKRWGRGSCAAAGSSIDGSARANRCDGGLTRNCQDVLRRGTAGGALVRAVPYSLWAIRHDDSGAAGSDLAAKGVPVETISARLGLRPAAVRRVLGRSAKRGAPRKHQTSATLPLTTTREVAAQIRGAAASLGVAVSTVLEELVVNALPRLGRTGRLEVFRRPPRTAADAPQAVRKLLKSYDPGRLRWSVQGHRHEIVVAIQRAAATKRSSGFGTSCRESTRASSYGPITGRGAPNPRVPCFGASSG